MTASHDWNITEKEQQQLNVLAHHAQQLRRIEERADGALEQIENTISDSEALVAKYGKTVNHAASRPAFFVRPAPPPLRSWEEVVMDAEADLDAPAMIEDLLSFKEIEGSIQKVKRLREEFDARHQLDAIDWSICGVAGSLAALVDIFLVWMPRHPGFLGGKSSEGGPLANWIRDKVNGSLTPAEIRQLEKEYAVPYDPSISAGLAQAVPGLSPSMHRFQSLGHDPLLCWIFGVKDILAGSFTALDKQGRWIVQDREGWGSSSERAMGFFEAIGAVFGHLRSDVATSASLPVPLMPLLQMFKVGSFGKHGHTLGELSRTMYRSGYDFRHFLAMTVAPLLVEVLVRLSYFAKHLYEGNTLFDALPFELPGGERKPKLRTMLFVAHLIATAANAGKVVFGQNPLLINWSQWLAFVRYAVPQLKYVLLEKEMERHLFVQAALNDEWEDVHRRLNATWEQVFSSPVPLA